MGGQFPLSGAARGAGPTHARDAEAGRVAAWLASDLLAGTIRRRSRSVSLALLGTAVPAYGLPAARAARVHPVEAIRAD